MVSYLRITAPFVPVKPQGRYGFLFDLVKVSLVTKACKTSCHDSRMFCLRNEFVAFMALRGGRSPKVKLSGKGRGSCSSCRTFSFFVEVAYQFQSKGEGKETGQVAEWARQ